ncbi:spermatogenesis-associated protein 31E1-like [Marmota flaviventris]|uniref:spermatogenesis-associated protein 31E1-like n=1 Tax=Marmota flaviventris TaxID=93162 RepID=UPI003A879602
MEQRSFPQVGLPDLDVPITTATDTCGRRDQRERREKGEEKLDSVIQKMENLLFPLNSVSAAWLNPSFTTWAVDMVLACVCGLGLFFFLMPFLQGNPSFPPPRKKEKLRKHPKVKKKRKKSNILKDYSDFWKKAEETKDLLLLLQSHLRKLQDDSTFHHLLKGDDPDEMCKPGSAGAHQSCTLPVQEALATAFLPLASLTPLSKRPLLLASAPSADLMTSSDTVETHSSLSASQSPESVILLEGRAPQPRGLSSPPSRPPDPMAHRISLPGPSLTPPQCDSMTHSLGTSPQSASPPNNYWLPSPVPMSSAVLLPSPGLSPSPDPSPSPGPSSPPVPLPFPIRSPSSVSSTSLDTLRSPVKLPPPVPAVSGHVLSTCPISSLSWWQMAARVCGFSHSPHSESKRDHAPHPPEDSLWANGPLSQVEAEGKSFINPGVQKLLEILISKRAEMKTKDEPVHSLNSLGSTVQSLGREQDTTIPQHFWNTKGKPKKLSVPQQLFYTKVLGDHLQQKCSQLFWGLPILHSESLVATVSMSEPSADFSSIAFNEVPNYIPGQVQAAPGPLFASQLLHPLVQLQPGTPTLSWSQSPPLAQIHHQDHLPSSLPSLPCHLPLNTACGFPCPTSQEGTQLLSPSLQHLKYEHLRKQLEIGEALPHLFQKSQNIFSHLTSENRASCDHKPINKPPGDFPSLDLQEKLDQHLQKRFMLHQYGLPPNMDPFLNLTESWDNIPKTGQAKDSCESSWNSVIPDNRSPAVQRAGSERPEIIQEGTIPVGVRHSRLGSYHVSVLPGSSNTQKETWGGPTLKGGEAFRNTSQVLSLLDASVRQELEAHVTSLRVRHRWGLPLRVPKHINILKVRNSEASPPPQPALPSSASYDSRANPIAHDAKVRGKPTQKGPGLKEVAQTPVPTQRSPLSGPSFESLSRIPSGDNGGLPDAPSTAHESSLPSQPHTYILVGRTWHNGTVLGSARDSLEPSPSLEMGRQESLGTGSMSSQGSCHSMSSLQVGHQLLKTEEVRELEDDEEESSQWGITKETRKTSNFPNVHINSLGSLESQGTSEGPPPSISSISQGQEYSCLKAQTEPKNQPQELATGVILQDFATDKFHQDCAPEVLLAADILASQERQSNTLSMSSRSASTSQCGLSEDSIQDLQGPKIPELQDPGKSRRNTFRPTAKRADSVRPRSGTQGERLSGGRPSCAGEMGPSVPVKEVGDTVGDKSSQAPSKRNFGDRIKNFLQNIFPSKSKGQANSSPKIMIPSTTTQSQGSVTSQLLIDNVRVSEAQALLCTFGYIIAQKMRFQHECSASKENIVKEKPQAPVGRQSHYARGSFSLERRRGIGTMTPGHQASPRGHSHPLKRWIRNPDNNPALLLKKSAPLPSPCQQRSRVAGISGHSVHCPRHCALQRHLLSHQHQHASHSCPAGKKFFP